MSSVTPDLIWRAGAILGAIGIATGALGAHAMKQRLNPDLLSAWQTASQYAFINGVALIALASHPKFGYHSFAGPAIAIGTSVFSGSIFLLVLTRPRLRFLGPITPVGGALMLTGWISLAL